VDEAQAQYANVNSARARMKQARYENARNRLLARTLDKSPALANIQTLKALPRQSTVILSPGGGGKVPSLLVGGAGNTPAPGG
jgi:hypothetical protein